MEEAGSPTSAGSSISRNDLDYDDRPSDAEQIAGRQEIGIHTTPPPPWCAQRGPNYEAMKRR